MMGLGHSDWSFVADTLGTGVEGVDGDEPLKLSDVKGLISSWRVRRRKATGRQRCPSKRATNAKQYLRKL